MSMTRLMWMLLLLAAPAWAADWERLLADRLPFYGHRNWIVIADSAYPAQARDGIETIVVNVDQVRVLRHVLSMLDASIHVRPILFLDKELGFIDENVVPGIGPYRAKVEDFSRNREVHSLPHEQIIGKLDEAGQTFKVLIIKTTMTMPYTSVFLQLDCAYWGPEAEQKLRASMVGK
jgi:L-fucose mutarotase/ribose pyranase (RbsD/FucU family)